MNYYVYRYQTFTNGIATNHCSYGHDSRFFEVLKLEGSCTRYAPHTQNNTTRVKPRNVLTIPKEYWPCSVKDVNGIVNYKKTVERIRQFLSLIATIPWTVDLSTVSITDYPEFLI